MPLMFWLVGWPMPNLNLQIHNAPKYTLCTGAYKLVFEIRRFWEKSVLLHSQSELVFS